MSPFSIHSTVTLSLSSFKEVTIAWCIRPVRNPTDLSEKDKWKIFIHMFWNFKQVWVDLEEVMYKMAWTQKPASEVVLINYWKVSEHHRKQTAMFPYLLFRAIPTRTSPSLQLFNSGISRKKHILSCHKTSYLKPQHATSGQKKSQDPALSKRHLETSSV